MRIANQVSCFYMICGNTESMKTERIIYMAQVQKKKTKERKKYAKYWNKEMKEKDEKTK